MNDPLHVVFKVADVEYALPARDVLEMETYAGATPVPGSSPWIAGLIQIRGRVFPVIDLRARFGHPPIEITLDSRVVVVQRGARTVGLLVDAAREVRPIAEQAIAAAPDTLRASNGGFVAGIARADSRLLMLIDLDLILGAEAHG